jgi:hypothetical protein
MPSCSKQPDLASCYLLSNVKHALLNCLQILQECAAIKGSWILKLPFSVVQYLISNCQTISFLRASLLHCVIGLGINVFINASCSQRICLSYGLEVRGFEICLSVRSRPRLLRSLQSSINIHTKPRSFEMEIRYVFIQINHD